MMQNSTIAQNLSTVRARVLAAVSRAGRDPSSVRLVAVSKTKPIELIREAVVAGQMLFGENYVQEAVDKINQSKESADSSALIEWHFIGTLQSNKAKMVAGSFALIHSVDRLKLAQSLDSAARAKGVVQPILLQIHIGEEETKHGFSIQEMPSVIGDLATLQGLSLCGLMALPPLEDSSENARANFALLRSCLDDWRKLLPADQQANFKELSMGTSSDFEDAILEGATLIRVGTTIFGARG